MSTEIDLTKPIALTAPFHNSSSASDINFDGKSFSDSDDIDLFKYEHPDEFADFVQMDRNDLNRRLCNETDMKFDDDFRSMFMNSSIVTLVVSGLSAMANLTLVIVIFQLLKKQLVPKKSYTLLLNLCSIDAIISLAVMLHSAINVRNCSYDPPEDETFSDQYHKSHDLVAKHALMTATVAAPALGYICLCVFEWISVRYPFYYASKVTKKKVHQAIALTWMIAIVVVLGLSSFHFMAVEGKSELDDQNARSHTDNVNHKKIATKFNLSRKTNPKFSRNVNSQPIHQSLMDQRRYNFMSRQNEFSQTDQRPKDDYSGRHRKRPVRGHKRHIILKRRRSPKFFNRLFLAYNSCELMFNFVSLITVVSCYLTVVRVANRRQTKIRFIRGLRMHFILFMCTTTICIICNCIQIYFNDFMNRQDPPLHNAPLFKLYKLANPQVVSASSSMDSAELNQRLVLEKCSNMAKMRQMKGLVFSSIVAGFLSLARLLVDALIYLVGNASIRQYVFGGVCGISSILAEAKMSSTKSSFSSTKSNEDPHLSIKRWRK